VEDRTVLGVGIRAELGHERDARATGSTPAIQERRLQEVSRIPCRTQVGFIRAAGVRIAARELRNCLVVAVASGPLIQ